MTCFFFFGLAGGGFGVPATGGGALALGAASAGDTDAAGAAIGGVSVAEPVAAGSLCLDDTAGKCVALSFSGAWRPAVITIASTLNVTTTAVPTRAAAIRFDRLVGAARGVSLGREIAPFVVGLRPAMTTVGSSTPSVTEIGGEVRARCRVGATAGSVASDDHLAASLSTALENAAASSSAEP